MHAALAIATARGGSRRLRRARGGFTLIEILVVIAILATLLSLLLPAARGTIASARSFRCQMALRGVAFDFANFADDQLHPNRGDDESLGGGRAFRLETFVEYEYSVDEFWSWGPEETYTLPDLRGNDPLRCPEVKGNIVLSRGLPCSQGAIGPPRNVSFGFNERLRRSERQLAAGGSQWVVLTSRILEGNGSVSPAQVPLSWDVDGARAVQVSSNPLFSTPSLDSPQMFANNRYWYPGLRHNGGLNVSFVDGHVASTRAPLEQGDWAWGFEPVR